MSSLLLSCALAFAGCASPENDVEPQPGAAGHPSLILITVDTLRADHLSCYGYFRATSPAIDALAQQGVLFLNALAPMATTLPSHTSLLTSTYPVRHGVLSNLRFFKQAAMTTDIVRSAAQMLAERGYRTAAFTSSSPLCEESGIGAGFQTFDGPPRDDKETRRVDLPAETTTDRALRWLEDARHPFFLWVHLFDPHHPYAAPSPYDRSYEPTERLWERLSELQVPQEYLGQALGATNPYDGEVQYADAQIGRLLQALEERKLYDDSIVVFTGDHGEGLYQHGVLEHGVIWNEQLRVPLILRFPGGKLPAGLAPREPKLASLIDVMPTLAAQAGLPLDTSEFDGIDLGSGTRDSVLAQREIRERVWPEENFALVGLEWKYIYFADAEDMLFDLVADPHETRNVLAEQSERAQRMEAELLALVADHKRRSPLAVTDDVPEDIRRRIEALGYVE